MFALTTGKVIITKVELRGGKVREQETELICIGPNKGKVRLISRAEGKRYGKEKKNGTIKDFGAVLFLERCCCFRGCEIFWNVAVGAVLTTSWLGTQKMCAQLCMQAAPFNRDEDMQLKDQIHVFEVGYQSRILGFAYCCCLLLRQNKRPLCMKWQ
jgi:hypothetical protein